MYFVLKSKINLYPLWVFIGTPLFPLKFNRKTSVFFLYIAIGSPPPPPQKKQKKLERKNRKG